MKTTEQIKASDTRQPSLTRAVIRQTGRENLPDIDRHGVDGGFTGFTYYSDTVAFAKRHKADIMARLAEDAESMGEAGVIVMLSGFRCLKGLSQDDIADGLYNPKSEHRTAIYNALAWYAAEEIASELNPDMTETCD